MFLKILSIENKIESKEKVDGEKLSNSVSTNSISTTNGKTVDAQPSDVLDHYRFILLIRNQLMQTIPFKNAEEYNKNELKHKKFKTTFDNLKYHYTELMNILDNLSNEAKAVTDIYKENV